MKHLLLGLAVACVAVTADARKIGGDGSGNGGYVPENHFISLGYDWLEALTKAERLGILNPAIKPVKLAEALRVTHIKFKHGVTLNGEPKSAVNFPKMNLITPDFDDWDGASNEGKYLLVLHEFLPLIGVNDSQSHVSIPLMKVVQAQNLLAMAKPQSDVPKLLFSAEYDSERQGLDYSTAARLCGLHKELNSAKYYFVYCVFLEKVWFQDEKIVIMEDEGETTVTKGKDQLHRWRRRPIETGRTRELVAYGLRVFGLGIEAELQFKVLASSLNLADGLVSREFDTSRAAYRACRARLAESNDTSFRFHQATCRAPQNPESGRYYYEIVTKNPLVE